MKISNLKAISLGIFGFAVLAVGFTSCKNDPLSPGVEYMPDMYRSASYETYSVNPFYGDSMSNRKSVPGTVTIGDRWNGEFSADAIPYPYGNTPEGYEAAGTELKNPLQKSEAFIAEGKVAFDKFCIHCHGATGMGDGEIVANGKFPGPPPAYNGPLKNLPEGKIFHVITYGKGLMGSHASQLSKVERWKVTMYVQQLQGNGGGTTAASDSTAAPKDTAAAKAVETKEIIKK
jgi:mono/diheme cytochrome c family protein